MVEGWRHFYRKSVAPSIFALGDSGDLVPQSAIGLVVEHARRRVNLMFSDPDRDVWIVPDVFDPSGGLAHLGEQIEPFAADHEPNFDLAPQACPAPGGGQIKDPLVLETLRGDRSHAESRG